jgi:hypothetical protein
MFTVFIYVGCALLAYIFVFLKLSVRSGACRVCVVSLPLAAV